MRESAPETRLKWPSATSWSVMAAGVILVAAVYVRWALGNDDLAIKASLAARIVVVAAGALHGTAAVGAVAIAFNVVRPVWLSSRGAAAALVPVALVGPMLLAGGVLLGARQLDLIRDVAVDTAQAPTSAAAPAPAVASALEACRFGDTSRVESGIERHRRALGRAGIDVDGASPEVVNTKWFDYADSVGADEAVEAEMDVWAEAVSAAAHAAELDDRFEDMHGAMSAYVAFDGIASDASGSTDDWYDAIRKGCELARELS